MALKRHHIFATLAVAVALSVTAAFYALQKSQTVGSVSLRDIMERPEKYVGNRTIVLTIEAVEQRSDPTGRLRERYYTVFVRDSEGYRASFVIKEEDLPRYRQKIGQQAQLRLVGGLGPGLLHPPDRLLTNILVIKAADAAHRENYIIEIFLL